MKKLLIGLTILAFLGACSQAPQSSDTSAITMRADAWETAINAGDIDTLVGLYTSDARVMPPNSDTSSGSDAVRTIFGGMIESGVGITTDVLEAGNMGATGYIIGSYAINAGGEVVDTGKYAEIWKRGDDGQWRIASDIWNSNRPMAAASDGPMTHVMITHEVDDADRWLAAWRGEDSRHELFAANGAAHVHTFRSNDNPNLTGLVVAVSDRDALDAMLASEEGMAAAAEDGVRRDTIIVLTEAK